MAERRPHPLAREASDESISGHGAPRRAHEREIRAMRGFDCSDPGTHADIHFSGADDTDIERQVRAHISEAHPDMSPDEAPQMVAASAYDE